MKKLLVLSVIAIIATWSIISCKKTEENIVVDSTAPVVTLKGDASMTVALHGTYDEPGATATDETDGDLSSQISRTGSLNTDETGTYTFHYSVCDKASNKGSTDRTINVVFTNANYEGTYDVTNDCGSLYSGLINTPETVTLNATGDGIIFGGFILGNTDLNGNISGQIITVPSQNFTLVTIDGTGSINNDANIITLSLNFTPIVGTATSCTITFTRQ